MRYTEKKSVPQVLEWLGSQGVVTGRQTYQNFLRRMLNLMDDAKAKSIGVNLELLRAVRRRLKLPIAPAPGRVMPVKPTVPFYSRSRRRRVEVVKKVKRLPAAPPARPPRRDPLAPGQVPLPGMVPPPSVEAPYARLKGTPGAPLGYADWKVINEVARAKLRKANRHVYPNQEDGATLHLHTRHEYTATELVEQFGLSPNEAESCSMSFEG